MANVTTMDGRRYPATKVPLKAPSAPVWAAVDAQLRQAYAQLDRLQAEYGLEALVNLEDQTVVSTAPTSRPAESLSGHLPSCWVRSANLIFRHPPFGGPTQL